MKHEQSRDRGKNRVVISGIGLVTPVGNNVFASWSSVLNGRSGLSSFNSDHDLGKIAVVSGRVDQIGDEINLVMTPSEKKKSDRFIHLALVAGDQALKDAGLDSYSPERFGTYVGVGIGGFVTIEESVLEFNRRGYRAISPFLLPRVISNEAPAWLSMKFGLQGPSMAVVNACSSGNDAIGQGFRAIQDGHADYMLAGGTESSLSPLAFVGFGNMRALSSWQGRPEEASRPFDKNRSGFVMSEGAGFLLLEREDLARRRGAKIYAEIVGYGANSDAYHITAIHPEGRGAIAAIKNSLEQAKINKEDVGYINAHGTATVMNDISETNIIKSVFGSHSVPVSSTKSMTGHMLGAAGGVEVAFTALAIKNGVLPPTINLDDPDPQCDLDYVPHVARECKIDYALSNSFGFGGANSVILLKRY